MCCYAADAPEDIVVESDDYIFRLVNSGDQIGVIGVEPKDPAVTPWIVRAYSLRIDPEAPLEPQMVYFTAGTFEDGKLTVTTSRGGTFVYDPVAKQSSRALAYNLAASNLAEEEIARRIAGFRQAYRSKKAYAAAGVFLAAAGAGAVFALIRRAKAKKA